MGGGDGLFFLMSAFYWDWKELLVLFLETLAISSAKGNGAADEETMEQSWNSLRFDGRRRFRF